jgi:hypothetical protein
MRPIVYNLVVAGMTLSAMNSILERLGLPAKPIEQKDIAWFWVQDPVEKVEALSFFGAIIHTKNRTAFRLANYLPDCVLHPVLENKPLNESLLPNATFQTANFMFNFRNGKLHLVMSTQTNVESVEHYREWAKMPSLVNSNEAYRIATNWLSRVYVDVPTLNRKYQVHVGQPTFWATAPTHWGEEGSNRTTLPLYYVTWSKGDYQAAKVGIFGPTKQFMGLTIGDPDQDYDDSLCSHVYLRVTNANELLAMTNVPMRMVATNQDLLKRFYPKPPPETPGPR